MGLSLAEDRTEPKLTVAQDAIEGADAYTSNAVLPTYSELLAALQRLMDAPKLGTHEGMRRARENAQKHLDQYDQTMAGNFRYRG